MSGYEIKVSVTACCPCCGNAVPPNNYMTKARTTGHPLDRDNPLERCDRDVFISPCADCFTFKPPQVALAKATELALAEIRADAEELRASHTILGGPKVGQLDDIGNEEVLRLESLVALLEESLAAARGPA